MSHSSGQLAAIAGVSVRTLHHYDDIGLLVPGERTGAGHRRYTDTDVDRLQQILFYRELGFRLEEVAALLDDPAADPHEHLRRQHALLSARIDRLREMAAAVERTMEARTMGISLTPEEKFEVFGDFDPDAYAAEAERRWGGSDAWRESRRRTAAYTKEDWKRVKEEFDALHQRVAELMEAGEPADGRAATDAAEAHRSFLSRTSYDCSHAMHVSLGEMYVADERFTATYEAIRPGLARYLRDAIVANAARAS
ncbi:MerR family transcriptional regulator [Streptomyces sp. AJS327]|uniref:MerR family transcriptional regulator n=1 Tax=Streptomyces sp. AJS327 TaxID=2545265 RepID=UPI0015DFBF62|nr:MerR family transcriptional regulator [Streptomyces sp. AJS327]MBA0053058.1 MerR family transcriptional regulator [Streptomyces sp. AJS327]